MANYLDEHPDFNVDDPTGEIAELRAELDRFRAVGEAESLIGQEVEITFHSGGVQRGKLLEVQRDVRYVVEYDSHGSLVTEGIRGGSVATLKSYREARGDPDA